MKFLGVLLDDILSWKEHIKYLENKIAQNIGLMYRARPFSDKESLLALYYFYIYLYLNFVNSVLDNAYLTNLKKLRSQQKHVIRIVHNKKKFEHKKELFKSAHVLNLYKLNILSTAVFMHRVHSKASTPVFTGSLPKVSHLHSTTLSTLNFSKPKLKLIKNKYKISVRSLAIWNDFVEDCLKCIVKDPFFKIKIRSKLIGFDNEIFLILQNVLSKLPL